MDDKGRLGIDRIAPIPRVPVLVLQSVVHLDGMPGRPGNGIGYIACQLHSETAIVRNNRKNKRGHAPATNLSYTSSDETACHTDGKQVQLGKNEHGDHTQSNNNCEVGSCECPSVQILSDTKDKISCSKDNKAKCVCQELNIDHFATWPSKLVEPMIRAATKPGDIVFDPFCGTAKTVIEAERLNRTGIGMDLSFGYLNDIAAVRLAMPLQRSKIVEKKLLPAFGLFKGRK